MNWCQHWFELEFKLKCKKKQKKHKKCKPNRRFCLFWTSISVNGCDESASYLSKKRSAIDEKIEFWNNCCGCIAVMKLKFALQYCSNWKYLEGQFKVFCHEAQLRISSYFVKKFVKICAYMKCGKHSYVLVFVSIDGNDVTFCASICTAACFLTIFFGPCSSHALKNANMLIKKKNTKYEWLSSSFVLRKHKTQLKNYT